MSKHRPDLFTHTLNHLRTGAAQDASDELAKTIEAARTTNKVATMTITLKIKPDSDGVYLIEEDNKSSLPKLPRGKTVMFGTPDGNLVVNDPHQSELELRSVSLNTNENQELKKIG